MARCTRIKKNGERCARFALSGTTVCTSHGANSPNTRAKAQVRAELSQWVLGTPKDEPGELLLRLITQSRMRIDMLATEQARLIAGSKDGSLRNALVGDIWASLDPGEDGEESASYKAGEYIRGLAQLESAERDRCARFCAIAIQAGLAERMVTATEKQVEMVGAALKAALEEAGLEPTQRRAVIAGVGRHLRLASGG